MKRRLVTAWAVASLGLAGCVTVGKKETSSRPTWISEPGDGVSAAAGEHINGRVAQEELAIARARDELARRMGVRVPAHRARGLQQRGGLRRRRFSVPGHGVSREPWVRRRGR